MSYTHTHPGERIRAELDARGWTTTQLSRITHIEREEWDVMIAGVDCMTREQAEGCALAFGHSFEHWQVIRLKYEQINKMRRESGDAKAKANR